MGLRKFKVTGVWRSPKNNEPLFFEFIEIQADPVAQDTIKKPAEMIHDLIDNGTIKII